MMTGYPTIASAVQALKEGAYDYLSKPLILDELRHLMARLMERRFLRGEVTVSCEPAWARSWRSAAWSALRASCRRSRRSSARSRS